MFRPNALKRRLREGKRALGCWTVLGSPPVIELLAYCGFDYLLLDQEHGFGEPSALLCSLQAMAATPNCTSIVRVPSNDPNYLKRVLDAGVEGVMVPNVETADDARAVVAACRYPPAGRRGSALGSARASDYGVNSSKYRQAAADELLIVLQIESPKAVEGIDAIAAVDGVDVLFIGPHDLSGTVGQLGDLKHPEVAKLIARAEEGIKRSGKPMGTVPHPGTTWREMFPRGYQMINAGSDVGRLRDGALADVKEFRNVYS
jgi:4-hydroxy-2-oxoheptanedioate aldolase